MNTHHNNNIIFIVAILQTIFISFVGCHTQQLIAEKISNTEVKSDSIKNTTIETTTIETIKESDVAQSVDADSAYAALQFKCDSLGNVLLVDLEQEQGKRTNLELQLKENILKIQAIQEKFEIIVKGLKRDKEVLIKENTELKEKLSSVQSQEKQEPVIVEKPIPDIVKWMAWWGAAALLILILWVALKIYRKFFLKL